MWTTEWESETGRTVSGSSIWQMHTRTTHQHTDASELTRGKMWVSKDRRILIGFRSINQRDRCTPKLECTFMIARVHTYDTREAKKVCRVTDASRWECRTIRHALIKADLCNNSLWSQYTRERGMERKRETEREREQRGWMKREEDEGLEHPLYKNRVGEWGSTASTSPTPPPVLSAFFFGFHASHNCLFKITLTDYFIAYIYIFTLIFIPNLPMSKLACQSSVETKSRRRPLCKET